MGNPIQAMARLRMSEGLRRMQRVAKAWDCDLPDNPYLCARYWTDKALAADAEAARRSGPEAQVWRAIAQAWREAIEHLRYPPMALPRRPLHKPGP